MLALLGLTGPRTTGALEAELTSLRGVVKGRQHAYRNQERTNRMLQLFQLQRNGQALTRRYTRIIRDHLKTHGGETIVKRRTPSTTLASTPSDRSRRALAS